MIHRKEFCAGIGPKRPRGEEKFRRGEMTMVIQDEGEGLWGLKNKKTLRTG